MKKWQFWRQGRRFMAFIWPPLFFLLCALLLFRRAIFEGLDYFEGDTLLFYFPIARFIDQAIDQGRLPFWTPYIFAGHPLLADGEAGMLYPPNLIAYFLLPASQAEVVLRVLRFFLASFFAYLYGRSLTLGRPAASVVGLAFAYGSFMVGQIHHTNLGTTALWFPLVLAGIEWSLRAGPRRRLACLTISGAALGAASLTVHVNPLLMMIVFVGLYVPFRLLFCPDVAPSGLGARLRRTFLALALPIGIGLSLGAVQLLPLWELGTFSRGRGVGYDFATGFAMPPANVITLLFPYFFRDSADGYWSPMFRWNTTVYVGIIPLVLAALAVVRNRNRLALFFAAIAVTSLALAFGDYSPLKLYALLWQLPLFSLVRGPARFTLWTTLALAVLAGVGMQALVDGLKRAGSARGSESSRRNDGRLAELARFPSTLCCLALALIVVLVGAHYLTGLAPDATKEILQSGYLSLKGAGLERRLAADPFEAFRYSLNPTSPWTSRALLWLVVGAGLLWGWFRWRARANLWQALLLGVVLVDLLGFAEHFHPTIQIDALRASGPAERFLQERKGLDRVFTLWPVFETWPDRLLPLGVAEAGGYSSLRPDRQDAFLEYAGKGHRHFLDLLSVRYVVAANGWVPDWLRGREPVFANAEVSVYERQKRIPRAFLATDIRVGTPGRIIAALADPAFNPLRTAWVEKPLPTMTGGSATESTVPKLVRIEAYASESVTVRADTPVRSLLVLTDSFYPGWTAHVDGDAQPIYRADYLFRGVVLPPGRHVVQFVFEPTVVRLGAWITLAAGASILLILLMSMLGKGGTLRAPPV